jgi:nucleotide-binding universal stress UspA family protein
MMLPIRTIVHPTDFSEAADRAYRIAFMIARECGARLIALHVVEMHAEPPPVAYAEMGAPFPLYSEYPNDLASSRERLHAQFDADRAMGVEARMTVGAAAEEILRFADETHCDLIVMGTHGRRGVRRLLMGSVAEAVLRRARCPVLTVRCPKAAEPSGADKAGSRSSAERAAAKPSAR